MTWFTEFKSSLKGYDAEEILDLYFFRPLSSDSFSACSNAPTFPSKNRMRFLSCDLVWNTFISFPVSAIAAIVAAVAAVISLCR